MLQFAVAFVIVGQQRVSKIIFINMALSIMSSATIS